MANQYQKQKNNNNKPHFTQKHTYKHKKNTRIKKTYNADAPTVATTPKLFNMLDTVK